MTQTHTFKPGDKVLYVPDLKQAREAEKNMATFAAPNGELFSMSDIYYALACRTVVATFPLFMVNGDTTDEVFEDEPSFYILEPSEK